MSYGTPKRIRNAIDAGDINKFVKLISKHGGPNNLVNAASHCIYKHQKDMLGWLLSYTDVAKSSVGTMESLIRYSCKVSSVAIVDMLIKHHDNIELYSQLFIKDICKDSVKFSTAPDRLTYLVEALPVKDIDELRLYVLDYKPEYLSALDGVIHRKEEKLNLKD